MARRTHPAPRIDPDIAGLAGALADPSRVAMLDALLDGNAHTIGALARHAGVTAATASGHLRRLVEQGLVAVARDGRERRVRLASPAVAQLLESAAALAAPATPPVATPATGTRARELRFARTCYDHLAGVVGVRVTGALLDRGWLRGGDDSFTATPGLLAWLADHGHPLADEPPSRRPLARACLDWSERTPHLAGRAGAAVAELALAKQWVVRVRGSRALRLTPRGRAALARELAVTFA
ncbi:MAG TPA: metalloregulator ArsR/SmtB family transcription factor [Kofleriaceae bacterium]|nr:metalloregulator ArsR/SmtB family transcription factor [Kofleriaceae bacterium]